MHQDAQADTRGCQQGIAPALAQGLAQHDGKVRPRAGHGQQVDNGNGGKFGPVG